MVLKLCLQEENDDLRNSKNDGRKMSTSSDEDDCDEKPTLSSSTKTIDSGVFADKTYLQDIDIDATPEPEPTIDGLKAKLDKSCISLRAIENTKILKIINNLYVSNSFDRNIFLFQKFFSKSWVLEM